MHISAQTRLYFNSRINLFLYKWDYDSVLMRWAKNGTFFCKYAFFFIANFRNKWMVWTFNIDLWTKPIKNRFAIMQAMTFHLSRRFQQLKWKNLFKFKKKVAIKKHFVLVQSRLCQYHFHQGWILHTKQTSHHSLSKFCSNEKHPESNQLFRG